jgi:16S rRNA (uracil1498-N3)-methyltransferase
MELYLLSPGRISMRRFFISPRDITNDRATVSGDLFHHMIKVLRLKAGDGVVLTDGAGNEFAGVIRTVGKESADISVEGNPSFTPPTGPGITLYQGLPKGDKLEYILQKATELGVAEVVPFTAERSVPRIKKGEEAGKIARWERIVQEAARQSGRSTLPGIDFAEGLGGVIGMARQQVRLLLWEEEKVNRLKDQLAGIPEPESIALIVGPEGGLSAAEAGMARDNGFIPVSLGPRILRTETAGVAMLSILQFYWGDMG